MKPEIGGTRKESCVALLVVNLALVGSLYYDSAIRQAKNRIERYLVSLSQKMV